MALPLPRTHIRDASSSNPRAIYAFLLFSRLLANRPREGTRATVRNADIWHSIRNRKSFDGRPGETGLEAARPKRPRFGAVARARTADQARWTPGCSVARSRDLQCGPR